MVEQKIRPEKITKPIQLLAAWLTGLVLVDGSFLTAASYVSEPTWAPGLLVIAAVLNVPIFLVALFLLQTRFRPQMLEDSYYSHYLEREYSRSSESSKPIDIGAYSKELTEHIIQEIGPSIEERRKPIEKVIHDSQFEELVRRYGESRTLSELYLRPMFWPRAVHKWERDEDFRDDLQNLKMGGLITVDLDKPKKAKITELGKNVAKVAKERGNLWSQIEESYWKEEGQSISQQSDSN